ncbi:MAG: hypothetical protein SFZ03_02035 [Candidatus Melainabacteria bacterium]|nr:hypothetical protein [Candidatus Melainabacteria bacterium]
MTGKQWERTQAGSDRRWYDQQPVMVNALQQLNVLPKILLQELGDGLVDLAENRYGAATLLLNQRSLGSARILGLHQASQKRRRYDSTPSFHRAMNYHYILPEPAQHALNNHAQQLIQGTIHYLQLCHNHQLQPVLVRFRSMVGCYVKEGQERLDQYLFAVDLEMRQQKSKHAVIPAGAPTNTQTTSLLVQNQVLQHQITETDTHQADNAT